MVKMSKRVTSDLMIVDIATADGKIYSRKVMESIRDQIQERIDNDGGMPVYMGKRVGSDDSPTSKVQSWFRLVGIELTDRFTFILSEGESDYTFFSLFDLDLVTISIILNSKEPWYEVEDAELLHISIVRSV